jgi:hypothetical protein
MQKEMAKPEDIAKCRLSEGPQLLADCTVPVYWNCPFADRTFLYGTRDHRVQLEATIRRKVSACALRAVRKIKVTCVTEYPILHEFC